MNTAAICSLVLLILTLSIEGRSLNALTDPGLDKDSNSDVVTISTSQQESRFFLGNTTSSSSSVGKKKSYKFSILKPIVGAGAYIIAGLGFDALSKRFG
ncbi:hypothetical protein OESDEN_08448 [Oesophagostomum dentatum]|uniref:Uncharacterized protein n=1 Tax=Oesophagostomum dentatum TaxID=61180 RepID=A0A0B1T7D0_OESDE|nr:hypothetical protein OESDEN_08448 [Oesophagostomum dentatum]